MLPMSPNSLGRRRDCRPSWANDSFPMVWRLATGTRMRTPHRPSSRYLRPAPQPSAAAPNAQQRPLLCECHRTTTSTRRRIPRRRGRPWFRCRRQPRATRPPRSRPPCCSTLSSTHPNTPGRIRPTAPARSPRESWPRPASTWTPSDRSWKGTSRSSPRYLAAPGRSPSGAISTPFCARRPKPRKSCSIPTSRSRPWCWRWRRRIRCSPATR
mmetsp:Transcript_1492/g.3234  ORF Transcript_1492/g.3234 Transcript_1492/m.3234 type:complete len:212 (-) Transcript_1492:2385-3020(-)